MTAPPAGAHRQGDPITINTGRLQLLALNYVLINPSSKSSAGTSLPDGGDRAHWVFLGHFGTQDQDLLQLPPMAPHSSPSAVLSPAAGSVSSG